jgi:hypothetical protein
VLGCTGEPISPRPRDIDPPPPPPNRYYACVSSMPRACTRTCAAIDKRAAMGAVGSREGAAMGGGGGEEEEEEERGGTGMSKKQRKPN